LNPNTFLPRGLCRADYAFPSFEEIDQVFSRVGVALRATDAATRTILGKHIVGSYKKNVASFPVILTHLYNCGNVRDLLQGKMFAIPCVTTPQAFRIARDPSDNIVKLQVQSRGYEDKWSAIDRWGRWGRYCCRFWLPYASVLSFSVRLGGACCGCWLYRSSFLALSFRVRLHV